VIVIKNPQIIEVLEERISELKEKAAREVADIHDHLRQTGAETRLRPRIIQNKGYSSFSICWRNFAFFNAKMPRRTRAKTIRKGRGYLVPRSRLLVHCRGCADWEGEYILEKEMGFAKIRKQVDLYSKSILALRQIEKEIEEAQQEKEGRRW